VFFILSKILHFLVSPFTWFIIMLVVAFIVKDSKRKRKWFIGAFSLLFIFSNPFFVNEVFKWWENPRPTADFSRPYDVGVLLGGSLRYYDHESNRPVYSQSVDRLMQTIVLYKSGKIKHILLSGGSGSVTRPEERESIIMLKVLEQTGIPSSDVVMENDSRNTYENAAYSAKLMQEKYPAGRFLLITSMFHMRRSIACFNKTGINYDVFPVDPRANYHPYTPESSIIPNAGVFLLWDALIHEWVGMITYKLMGYI
jgi:uncharacterized SAM-binding protein YcdF (DUF218 family)